MSWASVNHFLYVSPEAYQLVGLSVFAICMFAWGRMVRKSCKSRETLNEFYMALGKPLSGDIRQAILSETLRPVLWWAGLIAQLGAVPLMLFAFTKYVMS
jgi:hypothetical protein